MYRREIIERPKTQKQTTTTTILFDFQHLLDIHDQPPIVLGELILEELFQDIDGTARDLRDMEMRT